MANKKLYRIITILLLVFSLGLIGILGYNILKANRKIVVPDFVNKSVEEVNNWCGSLPSKYACTINYEKSKTIDVNYVISQSINSGEKLEKSIPEKYKAGFALALVLLGRYICQARKQKCEECPVYKVCQAEEKK